MLRRFISIVGLIALLIVFTASTVQAATINVANGIVVVAADGQCSLIEAIVNANNDAATHADCPAGIGADTISLASGSTYTLTAVDNSVGSLGGNGLPAVTSSITINGNGATITRGSGAPNFRIFFVDTSGNLALNSVTITKGDTGAYAGGGIYSNSATLTIANAILSNNTAGGVGGGLHSVSSTLTVNNSTVTNNSGYGIAVTFGNATVADSTFSNNSDDGLSAHGDPILTITGSTFSNNGGSGLAVLSGAADITNSTFSGNHDTYNGGGLMIGIAGSTPVVTVANSTFTSNSADNMGGAIASSGTLTINNSTISGNSVNNISNTGFGGGIVNGGNLTLNSVTLSNNTAGASGGGIYNWAGAVTINDSVLSGNIASGDYGGGGLYTNGYNTVTINNTVISGNSATAGGAGRGGGGIYVADSNSTVEITNSTLSGNQSASDGGGIFNGGTVTITASTLYNNLAAVGGGAISNGGTVTITNSTLSGNSASGSVGSGGGIATGGTVTITSSTLTGNSATDSGGNISFSNTASNTVTVRNTIIANSLSGGNCFGLIADGGNNLQSTDTSCGASIPVANPLLGPLANNGGPTLTHALLHGSPAIDAGNSTGCTDAQGNPLTTDQRGVARPQGGRCDIGAYEYDLTAPTLNFPSNGNTPSTTRPLFDWANVTGATSYTLQISTSQTFTTFVLNLNLSPSAYVMPTDLPRNTLLFWRVRANGVHGPGDWSRTRHFFSANPPGVPVLVSPANNATVTSNQPTLDWSDSSPAADYYEVQISTVSTFATFLGRGFSGKSYQSNYTPQAALSPGTPYFWRVRAVKNGSSGLEFSNWSAIRSFTTL